MSRLNFMQEHALAIQTVVEELRFIEQFVAEGGQLAAVDVDNLARCHNEISQILGQSEQEISAENGASVQAFPDWLRKASANDGSAIRRKKARAN